MGNFVIAVKLWRWEMGIGPTGPDAGEFCENQVLAVTGEVLIT
jgi:hypothetical protein